jgi:Tol biopolymer transport system component
MQVSGCEAQDSATTFCTLSMTRAAGTRLGSYEILSRLGAGGMGEVYLAHDERLGRKVAIKLLADEVNKREEQLRRLVKEARAASALNHPNILTVHEFGQSESGTHYIVTEYIEGQTLRQRLRDGRLEVTEALRIAAQAAAALVAAHQAGIIHRDIKPENIMVRRDGLVKVLDFGLAKLIAAPGAGLDTAAPTLDAGATASGIVLGTLHYMSPEQARGLALDARTDIFSLGAVLYEMLTRRAAFGGATPSDVIAAVLTTEPPPLAAHLPEAPAELQRIVVKALSKDRERRYQTTQDLLIDLQSLQQEIESTAHQGHATAEVVAPVTGEHLLPATNLVAARRFSLRHALIIVPLLLLAAAVIWWLVAGRKSPAAALKTVEVFTWQSAPGEPESTGAFSPDGREIAFASSREGKCNLWVKKTATGNTVQITHDEFNTNPIWSPSGDEIAFFSARGTQNGIWRIPALGGTETLIRALASGQGDARLIFWSKNGTLYFESNQNLFALDTGSAEVRPVTDFNTTKSIVYNISISPDEQRLAYISADDDGQTSVWAMPVRGGPALQLTHDRVEHRNTIWHPDGRRVLYSARVDGIFQIFAAYLDSGKVSQITFTDTDCFVLNVSADGARVLYGSSKEESDVWAASIERDEETAFAADIGCELWPDVSPDGKQLAYQSVRNLSQGDKLFDCAILTKPTGARAQPSQLAAPGFLPTWSPDGKQLAFMRGTGPTYNLWTVRATGGVEKQLTTDGLPSVEFTLLPYNRVQESSFRWSPDSRQIVYCSARSGQRNLWLVSADGANDQTLTANTDANLFVGCPLWSADGKRVAYSTRPNSISADGQAIYGVWVIDVETRSTRMVFQSNTYLRLLGWSATDKELLLVTLKGKSGSGSPKAVSLVSVSTESGQPRPVSELESVYPYNIRLSADKKSVAFAARREDKDNLWVMPAAGGPAKKLSANGDPNLYFSSLSWSPDGRTIYFGKQSRRSLLAMIADFQ